jgi:hypothetical protein
MKAEREALNKGRQNKREGRNRREKKAGRRADTNAEVIRWQ